MCSAPERQEMVYRTIAQETVETALGHQRFYLQNVEKRDGSAGRFHH